MVQYIDFLIVRLTPPYANEMSTDNAEQLVFEIPEEERLHQLSPHEFNSPSTNDMSNDNAEQLVLLEIPEKERLHQLPPPRREI